MAAVSVVKGMMVCPKDRDATRSKPQRISESFRVFFMMVSPGYLKIEILSRNLL
jgi:hypothetical protein